MIIFQGTIDSGYQDATELGSEQEMVVQVDYRAMANGECYTNTRQFVLPAITKWSNNFRNKKLVISIEDT